MTKRFDNTFIGTNGTALETYNTDTVADTTWAASSNTSASVIYSNTLRRPTSQSNTNQRINFFNTGLTSAQSNSPNNYEVTIDFSLIGYMTAASNVGVIVRGDNSSSKNGYFVRYRPNTGYQLFRQTASASTQIGTTNTTDLNPSSFPLRRRLRLSVVGSTFNVYLDTFNNGNSTWTIGSTPLITTTDSTYTTGKFGIWFSSVGTDAAMALEGFIINEFYIDDLVVPSNAPTSLLTSNQTTTTVDLSWATPSNLGGGPLTNYIVERTTIGGSSWTQVGTPTTNSLAGISLSGSGNDFRVRAITGTDNVGVNSTTLSVNPISGPVNSFTASSITSTSVTLNWTAPVTGGTVTSYRVEKSTLTGVNNSLVADWTQISGSPFSSSTLSISGVSLDANVGNSFRITPVSNGGDGAVSLIKIARPDQVTGFNGSGTTSTTTNLSWTAATFNNATVTGYIVEFTTIGGSSWSAISGSPFTSTSISNVSLSASGNDFRVRATNIIGTGANSSTISVGLTPGPVQSLSIKTFTPVRTDSPLNLSYFTFTDTVSDKCHLQWIVPTYAGSSGPILSYLIESSNNGTTGWTTVKTTGNTNVVAYNVPKSIGTLYFRVTAINAGGNGVPSNVLSVSSSTSTNIGNLLRENGVWSFFTEPRAVCYKNSTYLGWSGTAGIVGITKVNNITNDSTHFELEDLSSLVVQNGGAEIDDHDHPSIYLRQDGRISVYYGAHNDPSGIRTRTTTFPNDITQWSTSITYSPANSTTTPNVTLPTCYSNPRLLDDAGIVMYHFRTGTPPNAPHAVLYFNTLNTPISTATYNSALPLIQSSQSPWDSQRPYVHSIPNGTNRIDFFCTDGHPSDSGTSGNGSGTSLYHFYTQWDKTLNKARYYTTAGVEIVNPSSTTGQTPSLPIRPKISGGGNDPTLIWDGTIIRAWCWDITIDSNGYPCILFTTYDNGSSSFGFTNQRYRFSKWNGTSWSTAVDITGTNVATLQTTIRGVAVSGPGMGTSGVNGFTLDEPAYTGGICFDSQNSNIVYLSNPVVQNPTNNPALSSTDPTGIREIQEWRTLDNGITWTKYRDITTNTPPNIINARPYSPRNHDGRIAVVWWRGPYSGWVRCFNTNIWAASSASNTSNNTFGLASLGGRLALSRTGQLTSYAF